MTALRKPLFKQAEGCQKSCNELVASLILSGEISPVDMDAILSSFKQRGRTWAVAAQIIEANKGLTFNKVGLAKALMEYSK